MAAAGGKGKKQGGGAGTQPAAKRKTGRGDAEDNAKTDVLRAVILTESFQDRFRPFTVQKPRCLLPLANTPIIEYTLEFLAMNGVQEVYIYGGKHTAQVEAYISASRFFPRAAAPGKSSASPFSVVQFVPMPEALSIGDVLRDLDKRALVDGDFVLVHGDVVSNLSLEGVLAAHKARREADRNAIMTMVLRAAGSLPHRTRPNGGITPVFAVDSDSGRCLVYDEVHALASHRRVNVDPEIIGEVSTSFQVRGDLIDPGIDICTPEMLALWSDTFDYELPRRQFLRGVLRDTDISSQKVYAHIIEEGGGYAARANNMPMYEAVSKDVVGRWTFPLVPDCNIVPGQTYRLIREDVLAEKDVILAADVDVRASVIGAGTEIDRGCRIINSTIGRGCRIGANVVIRDASVWEDVTIHDGATVTRSIVADGARIGRNCHIPPGSLVSFDVVVGDGVSFTDPTALSTVTADNQPQVPDPRLLGPSTNAARFVDTGLAGLDPEDPSALERTLVYKHPEHTLSTSSISTFAEPESDDEDDAAAAAKAAALGFSVPAASSRSRLPSFMSDDSLPASSNFHAESVHWLLDSLSDEAAETDFGSTRLEFLALRLASNASESAVRRSIATAFVLRSADLLLADPDTTAAAAAARVLSARRGTDTFISEIAVGGKSAGVEGRAAFILALQAAAERLEDVDASRAGALLFALLKRLYDSDVLDEEGILAWWADERSLAAGNRMAAVRERCRVLVEWLENAEEEESGEEEDDD